MKKFNRKSASPPPPPLRRPATAPYLHSLFLIFQIPPPPGEVFKIYSPLAFPPLKKRGSNYDDVWLLRYGAWQTEFFVISDNFLPSCPHKNPKNQNFEKMKKMPGDNIILHMCTTNENHVMYGYWQTELFVILDNFLPFYPPKNWKNQNFECTENHDHML